MIHKKAVCRSCGAAGIDLTKESRKVKLHAGRDYPEGGGGN